MARVHLWVGWRPTAHRSGAARLPGGPREPVHQCCRPICSTIRASCGTAGPASSRRSSTRRCRARTCASTWSAIWASSPSRKTAARCVCSCGRPSSRRWRSADCSTGCTIATVERVLISCLDGEWSHELVASREEAVRRLLARAKLDPVDREGDFLNKPRPLHDLPPASPLRAMLDAWSECSGKYDRERLHRLLNEALHGRYMLVEPMAQSPGLLVKEIGTGFNNHAVRWLSRIRGLRVEDQPDYAYGQWIASLYREVLQSRAPSLHDVDAVDPVAASAARELSLPAADGSVRGRNRAQPWCWARRSSTTPSTCASNPTSQRSRSATSSLASIQAKQQRTSPEVELKSFRSHSRCG